MLCYQWHIHFRAFLCASHPFRRTLIVWLKFELAYSGDAVLCSFMTGIFSFHQRITLFDKCFCCILKKDSIRQGSTWVERNNQHVCRIKKEIYCKRDTIRQTRISELLLIPEARTYIYLRLPPDRTWHKVKSPETRIIEGIRRGEGRTEVEARAQLVYDSHRLTWCNVSCGTWTNTWVQARMTDYC